MAHRDFPRTARSTHANAAADAPSARLVISCGDCTMAASDACRDCIVTYLLADGPRTGGVPVHDHLALDADEAATVRLLQQAGLAPELRHPRHGPVLTVVGARG